jgi:hypothetical protein
LDSTKLRNIRLIQRVVSTQLLYSFLFTFHLSHSSFFMKKIFFSFSGLIILTAALLLVNQPDSDLRTPAADTRCYEMRIYYAAPGKLNDLLARFRNHTTAIFKKHGMTNVGYWLPMENADNKLIYVLSYPSREAREKSWKDFGADPEWQKVAKASEENGKLVAKVESIFMKTTDFSPKLLISKTKEPRAFELRTYKATPGNLDRLLARFRNHTLKLFEKYGMTNVIYWTPTDKEQGADDKLIYLLAHKSKEAGLKSFEEFRNDPDWVAVKKKSEEEGGGSLTVTVESVYMTPTDFSPMQ